MHDYRPTATVITESATLLTVMRKGFSEHRMRVVK
jgi:hypothetical protein